MYNNDDNKNSNKYENDRLYSSSVLRWYLSPKGHEVRWTAQWSPRKSEVPQEENFQTPMDVDVYGAAVSSCIRDMQVLALGSHQNAGARR